MARPASTLRYLPAADVEAAMPSPEERLALAETTLTALVEHAELPAKIGVHPRPNGSFAHAMPAFLRGPAADGSGDGLGIKWVAGFGDNARSGLPAINALVLLNEPTTGLPIAVLDGGPITAQRTAAVTGVAVRRFAPTVEGRSPKVALIGAGVQGHSHVAVLGHVLPGAELAIFDRNLDRAKALADRAGTGSGIAAASVAGSARAAVAGADVVVTAISFAAPAERQAMTLDWLAPRSLVVAVDYATLVAAEVARDAALFLVDDRGQFIVNRDAGAFDGYPDPAATIGEAILAGAPSPTEGRVLVTHLGVGLADVVFGLAILDRAERLGLGVNLPR